MTKANEVIVEALKLVAREANLEDALSVSELLKVVFSETYGHVLDQKVLQKHLDKYLSEVAIRDDIASSSYFLVEDVDKIFGVLKILLDEEHKAEIGKLYVLGQARANGIGTELIDNALKWSKENNATHIWLNVWKENKNAIHFYEKHNFKKVGMTNVYVGKTAFDDYIMERTL